MADKRVAIVILNWNQMEMTADCLKSVYEQDYPNFDVILVDNGSSDGSPEFIKNQYPQVIQILNQDNLGYSEGNNVGISYAIKHDYPYIFLLNNDTIVDVTMLSKLRQVAESEKMAGIVGPTMYYADPSNQVWGGISTIDWSHAQTTRHHDQLPNISKTDWVRVDYVDTCAILIKKEVFEQVGLLNNKYFINFDDLDLNIRARQAGYDIIHVPSAHMWHKVSAAMGLASPATTYYMTRNSLLFFGSYAPGIWKILAPAKILASTMRTIAAWTLKKKYQTKTYQLKCYANLFALRDFLFQRYGRMGDDVAKVCLQKD